MTANQRLFLQIPHLIDSVMFLGFHCLFNWLLEEHFVSWVSFFGWMCIYFCISKVYYYWKGHQDIKRLTEIMNRNKRG